MRKTVLVLLILLVASACSSTSNLKNAYYTTLDAYVVLMTEVNRNYSNGLIAPARYDTIVQYANTFREEMIIAKAALDVNDTKDFNSRIGKATLLLAQIKSEGGIE